jgi:hypothetical protein
LAHLAIYLYFSFSYILFGYFKPERSFGACEGGTDFGQFEKNVSSDLASGPTIVTTSTHFHREHKSGKKVDLNPEEEERKVKVK